MISLSETAQAVDFLPCSKRSGKVLAFERIHAAADEPAPLTRQQVNAANQSVAQRLARTGLSVFPCGPRKQALVKWRSESTTDAERIRSWWMEHTSAIVGMDLAKCGLIVIDCDKHDAAADGVAALAALEADHDPFDPHPIVRTPSGGEHHIFRQPAGELLGNSTGALPDGIDIRGSGGYVIAAGSVTPSGKWEADPDAPDLVESIKAGTLAEIPQWLVDIIRASKVEIAASRPAEAAPVASHLPGTRERAFAQKALEANCSELAGLSDGRNTTLNNVAYRLGRMVARGWLSESEVVSQLEQVCAVNGELKHKGAKQCRDTIASGLKSGLARPHEDLTDRERDAPKPNGTKRSYPFTLFRDIPANIHKSWLVDGWLGAGELSVWYGAPKSGKSVIVGDVDCRIAAGMEFYGHRVSQGAVLYLAAERVRLVERRFAAFRAHHEIEDIPLAVVGGVFDLCSSKADTRAVIETARQVEAATGYPLCKVTIDTAAQVLSGGDENSAKDMGAFVTNLQLIQHETGAHVSVIHHTPHYEPNRMRGHGSFLAAADTTVLVAKEATCRRATINVANDGPEGDSVAFGLISVELGTNPETGETTTAPVVVEVDKPPQDAPGQKPKKLTAPQQIALRALKEAINEVGEDAPASNHIPPKTRVTTMDHWRDYAYRLGISAAGTSDRARQQAFKRASDYLLAAQQVGVWGQHVWSIG